MDYRNDRDALRNQVDTLQQELATARHDQERLAGLEKQLATAQRDLAKAEGELARSRAQAGPPRPRWVFLAVSMAAVVLMAVAVGFFLARGPAEPPIPVDALPAAPAPAPVR